MARVSEDGNKWQHRDVDFFHERGEVGRKPTLNAKAKMNRKASPWKQVGLFLCECSDLGDWLNSGITQVADFLGKNTVDDGNG